MIVMTNGMKFTPNSFDVAIAIGNSSAAAALFVTISVKNVVSA